MNGNAMTLYIKGFKATNCAVGLSTPPDAPLVLDGMEAISSGVGIEIRDRLPLMQSLGLPSDTPPHLLAEVLKALEASPSATPEQKERTVRESELIKWLGATADLLGLASALTSAQAAGLVSTAVEKLLG